MTRLTCSVPVDSRQVRTSWPDLFEAEQEGVVFLFLEFDLFLNRPALC